MTAASMVKETMSKLKGQPTLPQIPGDFLGAPLNFKEQAKLYRAATDMQSGWPNVLRARDGGPTHNESVVGVSFTGLVLGPNGKKATAPNEVWLIARVNPHRPGPEGLTSVLEWHVAQGVVTPAIVQQATGFLAFLSEHGYMAPAKK